MFSVASRLRARPLRISVEGNIATGKSTFLRLLEETVPDVQVVQEPISKWTNVAESDDKGDAPSSSQKSGANLLDLFYKDSKRWAYTFQTYAFLSRLKAQMHAALDAEPGSPSVHIVERSIFSDRLCFAANCFDAGLLSEMEHTIYTDFHSFVAENFDALKLDGIIYLRSSPETCAARLKLRNRPEEESVALEYLQALHDKHEQWLYHRTATCPGLDDTLAPLVLDCNVDFKNDASARDALMLQVTEFVDGLRGKADADADAAAAGGAR